MRPASVTTTAGAGGSGRDGHDVVITHEPTLGSTLRTRGRFYLVCEADPPSARGAAIAAEVSEMVRAEYYYDLSAGSEVALRRALRKANRRAAQLVREERRGMRLHLACAALVGNAVYAARVGAAHVFLIRHARLFLPGEGPDELADFVHRTTRREASSLGAEMDLLPLVWRQTVQPGDTIVLASASVVDTLGADALKNAAITLHPRAASEHVRSRAIAEGAAGSRTAIFIEVSPASGAERLRGEPEAPAALPEEVVIAERVRSRIDTVTRWIGAAAAIVGHVLAPIGRALERAALIGLELMPRRRPALPRAQESARLRSARAYRATTLLAVLLLLVTVGVVGLAVQDYRTNQVVNDYRLRVIDVKNGLEAARGLASRKDTDRAWETLDVAKRRLDEAARSPVADPVKIAELRGDIAALEDRLDRVIVDLASVAPGAAPVSLTQTADGLFAADPAAGRLWRLAGEPIRADAALTVGEKGLAPPLSVAARDNVLFTLDAAQRVWRVEGGKVEDLALGGAEKWKEARGVATFAGNIYVLDPASGQVWRYAPNFAGALEGPLPFLPEALPPGTARGFASDGDIWIVTSSGEVQRYRRLGNEPVLTRLPFTLQWATRPLTPTAIQALEAQRSIWLLDANAKVVAQVTRDGREIARFDLPSRLGPATAFFVSEGQRIAYTVHGSRIAATDVSR